MRLMLWGGIILFFPAQAAKGPYSAPDREPTTVETLILEYMNRLRANPSAEADLISPTRGVDWKMFRDEMKALKPAPPLVFNLDLLESARKHSHYMILNSLGHTEEPGKPGFTGATPGDRIKLAGYQGSMYAENAFRDSGGAWHSHWGFVVDYGPGGTGGMQAGRGHRRNMVNPAFREVGPGAHAHASNVSVTHNFGTRDVRLAGGVIYMDLNGNRFYDPGEGVGNVSVSVTGGASATTWKSGAFAIEMEGPGEVTLNATYDGEKYSKTFPAGKDNVKFDWVIPPQVALRKADRLLESVDRARDPKSAGYQQAVVNLYVNTKGLYLDDDRRKRVAELTREVGQELEAAQKSVLAALKDVEAPGLQKFLTETRKPYRGTDADVWFADADLIARLKRGVATVDKPGVKLSPRDKRQLLAMLEQEGHRLRTPSFKAELASLIARAKGL